MRYHYDNFFFFSLFLGHRTELRRERNVPRADDDGGARDAQLLLFLRRVRGGPRVAEAGRPEPRRLRPAGHHGGGRGGRHAAVDGHVPGGRGQVAHTAGRRDADARLDRVHDARVPGRGHVRPVQRPRAHPGPVRALVRRAVHRLRVHQEAVRPVDRGRPPTTRSPHTPLGHDVSSGSEGPRRPRWFRPPPP